MGGLALLNHAINFLAPALWLAFWMPLVSRMFMKKKALAHTFIQQFAIYFAALSVLLVVGLEVFGRDGKMLTYLGLALVCATVQWWLHRPRRPGRG